MVRKERTTMTDCIKEKGGYLYVIFTYCDPKDKQWKHKWVSTGIKAKGNKKLVMAQLDEYRKAYAYLESDEKEEDVYFLSYMKVWHEKRKADIALNSWESYDAAIKKHIIPYFEEKNYRLDEITSKIVYEFYEYLGEKGNRVTGEGLSTASIKKVASAMHLCLKTALLKGMIPFNPTVDIPIPKRTGKKQHKHVCTTQEEAQTLLNAFKDSPIKLIVYMCLFYGLRKSEVIGLKWKYVDFENNSFLIKEVITKHITVIEKETPKTEESEGTYELLPDFKDMLLAIKAEQEENRRLLGGAYHDSGYVFCKADGTYYRPDCVYRIFVRTLEKAGLTRMRVHDLRHSSASVLFDLGWDIEKIKSWLRHRDIETTSNIYTHYNRKHIKKLAEELKDLYEI